MAIFGGARIRSLTVKLLVLGAALTFLFTIYTYTQPTNITLPGPSKSPSHLECLPHAYANGSWEYHPRTSATAMEKPDDALQFAGFRGCASSREYYWHLAADNKEQYDRFPKAQSYEWIPGQECQGLRPPDPAGIVKDLVEEGGWLLIGDSVTENHFFSLSCLLYPHVLASPNYTANPYFDRAWPQHLHLNPSSPLVSTLSLPAGFNVTTTPLVTFRRIDLLLSREEIETINKNINPSLPSDFSLFSEEAVWTLPVRDYLEIFTMPLPERNYGTMIVSTGGHWTTTLLSGLRDENKPESGYGIDAVLKLFDASMHYWAAEVQKWLWKEARGQVKGGRRRPRKVVIRSYLPGHEDCHNHREPWDEIVPFVWNWYNWGNIWEFNGIFERTVADKERYPNIHYLGIDTPARLRPDAHTTGDCLHIMAGAGVLEGWTHYIWHYINELR